MIPTRSRDGATMMRAWVVKKYRPTARPPE